MAIFIPPALRQGYSEGESKLFDVLSRLPEEYYVYQLKAINSDRSSYAPSYAVIGRNLGLCIIDDHNDRSFDEHVGTERTQKLHTYCQDLISRLKSHPIMRDENGNLPFPYGVIIVFSNIRLSQIQGEYLNFDPTDLNYCFRDEFLSLTENDATSSGWMHRIRQCLSSGNNFFDLDDVQINLIRSTISSSCYVSNLDLFLEPKQEEVLSKIHQKRGHQLVSGVAGSGKTLILAAYAKYLLREDASRKVLCLCFNVGPTKFLDFILRHDPTFPEGKLDNLEVTTFNSWASQLTRNINQEFFDSPIERLFAVKDTKFKTPANLEDGHLFFQRFEGFIERANKSPLFSNKENGWKTLKYLIDNQVFSNEVEYDAILIDEGHMFRPHWFACAVLALRAGISGTLLIIRDNAQAISDNHNHRDLLVRTWREIGVRATGDRSRYLLENYRNTRQIIGVAWSIIESQASETFDDIDIAQSGFPKKKPITVREGDKPTLNIVREIYNPNDESKCLSLQVNCALEIIESLESEGIDSRRIAILYRRRKEALIKNLLLKLEEKRLGGGDWVTKDRETLEHFNPEAPGVKIITTVSVLGMEFEAVVIIWLDQFHDCYSKDTDTEIQLRSQRELYVAMTRARKKLCIVGSQDSLVAERLRRTNLCSVNNY